MSAEPREPKTVENLTNTGVSSSVSFKNLALENFEMLLDSLNTPFAAAPRARTTRSGILSWSK